MVNFGPLAAEIVSLVWGTPGNFNGFRVLAALLHGALVVGVSQTAALNRGRHVHSAGRPSRWALAHISRLAHISNLFLFPTIDVSTSLGRFSRNFHTMRCVLKYSISYMGVHTCPLKNLRRKKTFFADFRTQNRHFEPSPFPNVGKYGKLKQ